MRQILLKEIDLNEYEPHPLTCRYHLLVRFQPPPINCESYGLGITIPQTGEHEEIRDITFAVGEIETLATRVIEGRVTPCTLRDIVEDWLAAL